MHGHDADDVQQPLSPEYDYGPDVDAQDSELSATAVDGGLLAAAAALLGEADLRALRASEASFIALEEHARLAGHSRQAGSWRQLRTGYQRLDTKAATA